MKLHPNWVLGATSLAIAALLLLVWIPLDVGSGYAMKQRGQWSLGDSLAPGFAAMVFAIAGALLLLGPKPDEAKRLSRGELIFLGLLMLVCVVSLALMRALGPTVTELVSTQEYRILRDTAPWKYIGFAAGGLVLVTGLISVVERRFSLRALAIGVFAVTMVIVLYDLPFEDLLLPPNGDV